MLRLIYVTIYSLIFSLPCTGKAKEQKPNVNSIRTLPKQISLVGSSSLIKTKYGLRETTLIPSLQQGLTKFIRQRGNPISGVVVVEASTGKILAMVEGRSPHSWGGQSHTTLHELFPAASLFKTIVASAAVEIVGLDPSKRIGLIGGCGKVRATGGWMTRNVRKSKYDMNLKRAYGHSCNGFFAKLAINHVGLGPILEMANRYHWLKRIPADFDIPISPIVTPSPFRSSVHTIGRFAAGFGYVGTSVMHSAWRGLVVANQGRTKSLNIFTHTRSQHQPKHVITSETSKKIRKMMVATIRGGTASSAFRSYRYRKFRKSMGGKTGTLTGHSPEGLTTWFTGIYPIDKPQIVVSAVTVVGDLWIFKAPNLAAEAVAQWHMSNKTKERRIAKSSDKKKASR